MPRRGDRAGGLASGLRLFAVAHVVAVVCLVAAYLVDGFQGLTLAALLGVLEVAVSFDNAIVNATVLARLGPFWQRMFLTVGILVAAIGMRLLVPLAVVCVGARLTPIAAVDLAYTNPAHYRDVLHNAQPGIAAFGGAFLLMIFIGFIVEERDAVWIKWIERPMRRLSRIPQAGELFVLLFALVAGCTVASSHRTMVLVGAVAGLFSYLLINNTGQVIAARADADGESRPRSTVTGKAAFFLFCYLELLDATFSFDSVMGAFSVTLDIALITVGLAIGAAYIRALTVFVVRRGSLEQYRYLEHGAYYAIGMLAILLMVEVWRDVPDVLTAGAGAGMIIAAIASSVVSRRRTERRLVMAFAGHPDASVHVGLGLAEQRPSEKRRDSHPAA